ncbi:hypothetical protein SCHPADRAFT_1000605, partial [Schizopora paradoxa]
MIVSNALPNASHDESQSSQIMGYLLDERTTPLDGTKSGPLTAAGRENASVDGRMAVNASGGGEASSCPSGSSSSSSFSRYHFHGLASTQTQTQSQFHTDDSLLDDESSQKENTPTHPSPNKALTATTAPAKACSQHEAPLTPPPPLRSSNLAPVAPQQPFPLPERAPPTQGKAVKFLSPPRPPSSFVFKAPQDMPFKRKRSPSPSSQDSFAAAPAFENPDVYLANAKQFDRPLDQLGVDSQEEESNSSIQSRHEQVP